MYLEKTIKKHLPFYNNSRCSVYLSKIFDDSEGFVNLVDMLSAKIKLANLNFSHIACMGISGSSIAYPLRYKDGYSLLHVRKSSNYSHGITIEASPIETKKLRYIIVDDFISSGTTINNIINSITNIFYQIETECVGIFLYERSHKDDFSITRGRDRKINISTYYQHTKKVVRIYE